MDKPKTDLPLANDIAALMAELAELDRLDEWSRKQVTDSRVPAMDGAAMLEALGLKRRYLQSRMKMFLVEWAKPIDA